MGASALAQVETIDPNQASSRAASRASSGPSPQEPPPPVESPPPAAAPVPEQPKGAPLPPAPTAEQQAAHASARSTYQEDDVLAAAEGVFGKGAKGLAQVIEKIFKKQGRPNGYIAGREAGGAFVAGVRYGSGTLFHKIEGQRPVYWQGPSLGFDFGANGAKTFVLVYNLYDTQDLYKRYPAVEGSAFVVGGFQASYLQRGHVILVPIRLGVGLRLGANLGYMKITEKRTRSPF
jgi:hypothetical protein